MARPRLCSSEHFQKYCSHPAVMEQGTVFLSFGFVSAQSQGFANLLLRQSLAKTQKSSLRMAALFLQTLHASAGKALPVPHRDKSQKLSLLFCFCNK